MQINRETKVTSGVINFIASILEKTWRYTETGMIEYTPSNDSPVIYSAWHENILPLAYYYKKLYLKKKVKFSAIISENRDGRLLASILEKWDMTIVSGSTSKKGLSAVREAVREMKRGRNLIVTPDGPRGPRQEAKEGVALIGIISGFPVVPISLFPRNLWRLWSWDRFIIPKPFTKIEVSFGAPLYPKDSEDSSDKVFLFTNAIQKAMVTHIEGKI